MKGFVVTGKGAYESKSIFLPVGGYGLDSGLHGLGFNPKSLGDGACGSYWSSTQNSNNPDDAWYLHFNLGQFFKYDYYRYGGQLVRPVRGFAK